MSDEDVKKKLIKFDRNFIKKLFWKSTSQELVPCTPEQKNKTLFLLKLVKNISELSKIIGELFFFTDCRK